MWWLSRESGRRPPCVWKDCLDCGTKLSGIAAKAFMVIGARDRRDCGLEVTSNTFAELSLSRVGVTVKWILPQMDTVRRRGGEWIAEWGKLVHCGMFSSDDCTGCSIGEGLCSSCKMIARGSYPPPRAMVEQASFEGCFPEQNAPWWTGVTDAGWGSSGVPGIPWLRCWGRGSLL